MGNDTPNDDDKYHDVERKEKRREYVAEIVYGIDGIEPINNMPSAGHRPIHIMDDIINDISAPIIPNNMDQQSDIYTTDDNQIGFMYDSEQMAVYNQISNERIAYDVDTANEYSHQPPIF